MSVYGFGKAILLRVRPIDEKRRYKEPLSLYSVNVCSLSADSGDGKKRYQVLADRVFRLKPHIICVQETWLDESKQEFDVGIEGYELRSRRDRKNMRGGGVAIYVRKGLTVLDTCSSKGVEVAGLLLEHDGLHIPIFSAYRPPKLNKIAFWLRLHKFLTKKGCNYFTDNVIAGDLNMDLDPGNSKTEHSEILVQMFMCWKYFIFPRIYVETHKERIIDQVFLPEDALVTRWSLDDPIESSHSPVFIEFRLPVPLKEDEQHIRYGRLRRHQKIFEQQMTRVLDRFSTLHVYGEWYLNRIHNAVKQYKRDEGPTDYYRLTAHLDTIESEYMQEENHREKTWNYDKSSQDLKSDVGGGAKKGFIYGSLLGFVIGTASAGAKGGTAVGLTGGPAGAAVGAVTGAAVGTLVGVGAWMLRGSPQDKIRQEKKKKQ